MKENTITSPGKGILPEAAVLINSRAAKPKGLVKGRSQFSDGEKNALKQKGQAGVTRDEG